MDATNQPSTLATGTPQAPRGKVKTTIRLPGTLHARVAELASDERRSFNAQVEIMLADAAKRARIRRES